MNYNLFDNNSFQNNINNMNIINNFPSENPKFVNPFLIQNNNKYPIFDDENNYLKNKDDYDYNYKNNYFNINQINLNNNTINNNTNNYNNTNALTFNDNIKTNYIGNDSGSKKDDFVILNDNFSENLIRTMAVLNSSKNATWKDNLKSFVSSLYYNNHNFSIKMTKESIRYPIYIYLIKK